MNSEFINVAIEPVYIDNLVLGYNIYGQDDDEYSSYIYKSLGEVEVWKVAELDKTFTSFDEALTDSVSLYLEKKE